MAGRRSFGIRADGGKGLAEEIGCKALPAQSRSTISRNGKQVYPASGAIKTFDFKRMPPIVISEPNNFVITING